MGASERGDRAAARGALDEAELEEVLDEAELITGDSPWSKL
jgi:hypothetical protein